MSGEVIVGVFSVIFTVAFALSQYLINVKLLALNNRMVELTDRLVWFTGAMESHSDLMVRLEAKRQGVRTIWWDPEAYRKQTGRKFPKTASHGESAEPQIIRVGVPLEDRADQ